MKFSEEVMLGHTKRYNTFFFFHSCASQGLRGFLPGSHMCGGLPTEDAVGKVMKFKFLEVRQAAWRFTIEGCVALQ